MLQSSACHPLLTSVLLRRLWFAIREAQGVIKSITPDGPPVVQPRIKQVCVCVCELEKIGYTFLLVWEVFEDNAILGM